MRYKYNKIFEPTTKKRPAKDTRLLSFNGILLKRLEKMWKADKTTDDIDFGYWFRGLIYEQDD